MSKVNIREVKNCYDITKIKAEYERVNNQRELKIRRIEDTTHEYAMRIMRMADSDLKRKMELKLIDIKQKLSGINK